MNDNELWKSLMREQQKRRVIEAVLYYASACCMAMLILATGFGFAFLIVKIMEQVL